MRIERKIPTIAHEKQLIKLKQLETENNRDIINYRIFDSKEQFIDYFNWNRLAGNV